MSSPDIWRAYPHGYVTPMLRATDINEPGMIDAMLNHEAMQGPRT